MNALSNELCWLGWNAVYLARMKVVALLPPTNEVFRNMCQPFCPQGDLCMMSHVPSRWLSVLGVSVKGGLCLERISVQGGLHPERGVCPGGVSVQERSL